MLKKVPWFLDARICWMVLVAFCALSLLPSPGNATLIGSRLADGAFAAERQEQIETIRHALEHEVVAQRLADFGLSAEAVADRLTQMSDEQLHQLASLSDRLGEGGVLGTVIAILIVVLLVVVILRLTDKQVIVR